MQTKISTLLSAAAPSIFALTSPANDEPTVEAFFEGSHPVYEGAQEDYSSQSIIIREKQGSTAATQKGAFVASGWKIQNGTETAASASASALATNLAFLGLQNLHRPMEITAAHQAAPPHDLLLGRMARIAFRLQLLTSAAVLETLTHSWMTSGTSLTQSRT